MGIFLYNMKEEKNQLDEKKSRQLGLLKDVDFWIANDFDEIDNTIEKLFYGEK